MTLSWSHAPYRTSWGRDTVEALVELDADHTLRLYTDAESVHLVGPALARCFVETAAVKDSLTADAAPSMVRPLTDQQISDAPPDCADQAGGWETCRLIARAIEQAHGITEGGEKL